MEEHDSYAEVVLGGGDAVYLRRELGKVLPVALATMVQLQPSDPIEVLAQWLHKYRELHPLDTEPTANNTTSLAIAADSSVKLVQSRDDMDDSGDQFEFTGHLDIKSIVHREVVPGFGDIGDLFDDDDLG